MQKRNRFQLKPSSRAAKENDGDAAKDGNVEVKIEPPEV